MSFEKPHRAADARLPTPAEAKDSAASARDWVWLTLIVAMLVWCAVNGAP